MTDTATEATALLGGATVIDHNGCDGPHSSSIDDDKHSHDAHSGS